MDTLPDKKMVATTLRNPFPGLRPFSPSEAHLFFGRDGQSEEILQNLAANRFAAVLGASGSGKSSLIYCGLLPTLLGGFLHNGRTKWRIAISRPGSSPIRNLSQSLAEAFSGRGSDEDTEAEANINLAMLKRSASGITTVVQQCKLAQDENLLILVDQFEELFRYQYSGKDTDAADLADHFVNLIVDAVRQTQLPIYVVITMRSDFIGDCSPYQHLTKLINDSHYLIPRMNRDDFRSAIVGPVAVAQGRISDQLAQLLLNEMGNNPDNLPILQHALMRTWDYWVEQTDASEPMGIAEYEAIGRLERALSNHANEAFDELTVNQKRVCEVVLKSLTEKGGDNRGIRRPTKVSDLAHIAETTPEEVMHVVEVFRAKGRTFLTPGPSVGLTPSSVVDISHESLMRVWDKLKVWVEEESSAVKMYIRLAESADLFSEGRTSLWGPPDLQLATAWRNKQNPNLAWAVRYHPAFERTMVYLRTSEEEYLAQEENKIRLQKRAIRRSRIVALILGTAGMISIGLGILALIQRQDALKAGNEAIEQRQLAVLQAEEAEKQRLLAEQSEKEALEQQRLAEESQQLANQQRALALQSLNEADRQRLIAEEQSLEALRQQKLAENSAIKAQEQQQLAEKASRDAERRRMLSIARSMAVKSQQMRTDTLLKGQLAYQAYHFNKNFQGIPYDPDIFGALYSGMRFFRGLNFNVFPQHNTFVRTFAAVGNRIYSSGSDGQLVSMNPDGSGLEVNLNNLSIVKKLAPFGTTLYALTNNSILAYDTQSKGVQTQGMPLPDGLDLFVGPNGQLILIQNLSVRVSDGFNNAFREVYKSGSRINAATFNPATSTLYIGTLDGAVWKLNPLLPEGASATIFTTIPGSGWSAMGYHPQKSLLAAGFGNNQGAVYIWNTSSSEPIAVLRGHNAKITGISFSSDGSLMATSSYDGTMRLWHTTDLNTLPMIFDDHESWVTTTAFAPGNQIILTGDRNGRVRLFPTTAQQLATQYCNHITQPLSVEEWNSYVGGDIPYDPIKCSK